MKTKTLIITLVLFLLTSCTAPQTQQPTPAPGFTNTVQVSMANPASVYCEEQGNRLEIRTAADGSQSGVCIFPDGSECDEWAYFRGECKPGDTLANSISTASPVATEPSPTATAEFASDGWKIYRNEKFGYSFHYPADTNIVIDDEPLNSVSIIGPLIGGDNWPMMGFSHPSNREEYRPPEGVDLEKWLIDHYMWTPNYPNISDFREADVQIAGVSAIHIRHRRSGQSYASDKYLFARDGQLYQVGFLHIGDKEDWDIYNHFLESIQFDGNTSNASAPTAIPTAVPFNASDYQGWWTYTHPVYNFSIMLPEDWSVDETPVSDPLMNGHMLMLHPRLQGEGAEGLLIRMTFRRTGEDTLLWPTGVGAGEFVQQETLDIAGQPARRILFVCPTGQVNEIWYHGMAETEPNILRGDMEFGFIFSLTGFYCEEGHSLYGKLQRVGEMIIASLKIP